MLFREEVKQQKKQIKKIGTLFILCSTFVLDYGFLKPKAPWRPLYGSG